MGVWEFAISISIQVIITAKNNTNECIFSNFPFIHLFISLSLIKKTETEINNLYNRVIIWYIYA